MKEKEGGGGCRLPLDTFGGVWLLQKSGHIKWQIIRDARKSKFEGI